MLLGQGSIFPAVCQSHLTENLRGMGGRSGGGGLGKARLVGAVNRDALCVYSLVSTPYSGELSLGIKTRLGHLGQGRVGCVMQGGPDSSLSPQMSPPFSSEGMYFSQSAESSR